MSDLIVKHQTFRHPPDGAGQCQCYCVYLSISVYISIIDLKDWSHIYYNTWTVLQLSRNELLILSILSAAPCHVLLSSVGRQSHLDIIRPATLSLLLPLLQLTGKTTLIHYILNLIPVFGWNQCSLCGISVTISHRIKNCLKLGIRILKNKSNESEFYH